MNKLNLKACGSNHPITLETDTYVENGNLYVGLICWDYGFPLHWSNLTVNLGVPCKKNCSFIDTNNNGNGIVAWLEANKLGKLTGRTEVSGYCVYPEFKFDMEEVNKYLEEF